MRLLRLFVRLISIIHGKGRGCFRGFDVGKSVHICQHGNGEEANNSVRNTGSTIHVHSRVEGRSGKGCFRPLRSSSDQEAASRPEVLPKGVQRPGERIPVARSPFRAEAEALRRPESPDTADRIGAVAPPLQRQELADVGVRSEAAVSAPPSDLFPLRSLR